MKRAEDLTRRKFLSAMGAGPMSNPSRACRQLLGTVVWQPVTEVDIDPRPRDCMLAIREMGRPLRENTP